MKTDVIPLGADLSNGKIPHGVAFRLTLILDPSAPSPPFDRVSPWSSSRFVFRLVNKDDSNTFFYSNGSGVKPFPETSGNGGWTAKSVLETIYKGTPPSTGPQPSVYYEVWSEEDERRGRIPWGDPGLSLDAGGAALVAPGRRWRTLFDSTVNENGPTPENGGFSPIIDCSDCMDAVQLYANSQSDTGAGETLTVWEIFPQAPQVVFNGAAPLLGPMVIDGTGPVLLGQIAKVCSPTGALHGSADCCIASPPPFIVLEWSNESSEVQILAMGR